MFWKKIYSVTNVYVHCWQENKKTLDAMRSYWRKKKHQQTKTDKKCLYELLKEKKTNYYSPQLIRKLRRIVKDEESNIVLIIIKFSKKYSSTIEF